MIKSKKRIEESIANNKVISYSYRTIASDKTQFSKPKPYTENTSKFLYNSKIVDGVKFNFDNKVTLYFNARHNFY